MPIYNTLSDLADIMSPNGPDSSTQTVFLWGEIISITGMSFNVRIPGDEAVTRIQYRLDSYTPTVGDRVVLAQVGTMLVVLGAIVGAN